jgi:WD40 repeat protein/chitodextrinase
MFSDEQSPDDELLTFTVNAAVNDVAFSPDDKTLASATDDKTVILSDVSTGELTQTLTGHDDLVAKVAFSSDWWTLTSVGKDGEIITWEIATDDQQFTGPSTPEANTAQAEISQPLRLATGNDSKIDSGIQAAASSTGNDSKIDSGIQSTVTSNVEPLKYKAQKYNKKGITALAISQDGKLLASAGQDGMVRLLDITNMGKEILSLKGHHGAPVSGVAFSVDGKRVFSVGRDSETRSWDVTNGKKAQELRGQSQPVRALAISPDGKFLATGGEETRIMLYDAESGKLIKILSDHISFVNTLSFNIDGTLLASGGADNRVNIWDVKSGRPLQTLLGHSGEVNVVAFDPKGRLLASGGQDTQIRVWDVETGRQIWALNGHQAAIRTMAFSPNGQKLVSAGEESRLLVWNMANGKLQKVLAGATNFVNSLIVRPNGKMVVGTDDSKLSEIDIETGTIESIIEVPTEPQAINPLQSKIDDLTSANLIVSKHFARLNTEPRRIAVSSLLSDILGQFSDWLFPPASAEPLPDPNQGPGGPILVINSSSSIFGNYYAEILRNEGFNAFIVADIATVTQEILADYDVVVLAAMPLSTTQVTMLSDWVNTGGNLIAMRPDQQLADLLGLTPEGSTLSNGYLLVDTSKSPGNGIVGQTIQFHGTADLYTLSGASGLATLYNDAVTATSNPALTLRSVGTNGGQAAAFAYDLATSIVYTRQGNPDWAAQERDGYYPIRSDDKFYGDAIGDSQPDWVDLNKVAIPQADEQQRLLANLILQMNFDKMPLPRFWYFPRGKKAVVIMTGDDHGSGGTVGRFDQFKAQSPSGCSVADWECIRGTSYIYSYTPLTNTQAAAYTADGFEIGLHINTNCADFTSESLEAFYAQQIDDFTAKYSSIPPPLTQRHHCIAWSDWVTAAKVQLNHDIRLDTSYYFWPPGWALNRPGFFTGSGMPMRFADLDGTIVDVYHAATQMTDESGQQYPYTIDTLLDRALGPEGYYGAFTINAHTDLPEIPESDAVVTSALDREVPIVSSKQMLEWLDGRNSSSFGSLSWSGNTLSFTVTPDINANGLQVMVPTVSRAGVLTNITRDGGNVTFTTQVIKGIAYAFSPASAGTYVATYEPDTDSPTVTSTSPSDGASDVSQGTTVTANFSEIIDSDTLTMATFELRAPDDTVISATVTYNATAGTAILTPAATLLPSTTYTATLKGGSTDPRIKDLSGNALVDDFIWSFTTAAGPGCPCSGWDSSITPTNPSASDPNAVELGVKFRSDLDGFITGIRFYKGTGNTGTHVGNLWTATGQQLASSTFTNETATGWQEMNFPNPIAITANTVYVASYYAPNGGYACDMDYFAGTGFQNGPMYFLRDGDDGGNGVYVYSASTSFPNNTWRATNYWVDPVFTTNNGTDPDTTPPTVTSTFPGNGATGVGTGVSVKVIFSEAMDAGSIDGSTFELRDGSAVPVPTSVSYDAATNTATLTPFTPLEVAMAYTARVFGGSGGVTDAAGNSLAADFTWSFTTVAGGAGSTHSIWDDSAAPTSPAITDGQPIEVGVKFRADTDGYITGVRFYKGSANTGTHVGNLWTASGTLLATATFTNETGSGWQEVLFSSPVPIVANTTYVASYHSALGYFAFDESYFLTGVDNSPLRALAGGEDGPNGVYEYGASGFPTASWNSSNYWVDVVFTMSPEPDTVPPSAPSNLAAIAANSRQINLSWSASVDNERIAGYKVERCQGVGCSNFTEVGTTVGTGTVYSDIGLQVSTNYSYRVRAIDGAGNLSPYSNTDSAITLTPGNRDSVVLVNHLSPNYVDFEHFIKPYLDNFGVAYDVLDIATTDVLPNMGDYATIIIGHRQLDADVTKYLEPAEQDYISAAVNYGTGLVNFDNDLFTSSGAPRYVFIQDIFGFSYQAEGSYSGVTFSNPTSHYITERHDLGQTISTGSMTLGDITLPSNVTALVTSGGRGFLSVTQYGTGRAVQWGTYEWMSRAVKGPLFGLDDLVWRSIVWTARKPFAMQGLPPFVTMRMDDVSGPLWWIHAANDYGFIPWAGIFTNDIDDTEAADLSNLVSSGKATATMHAFNTNDFFYFDHWNSSSFSDNTMADHYGEAAAWFDAHQISISKYLVPHYYEIGSNAFNGLENWGVEFIGTMMDPGQREDSAYWMMKGPFRLYETGTSYERNDNVYYADFMTIPGHPEMDGKFFNCVTEIRDVTGYEWLGNGRIGVADAILDGTEWLKRSMDSMVLATLFSHEYTFINSISQGDWRTIIQGITQNIAAYDPIYVSLDYACKYVRAIYTSNIITSDYDSSTHQIVIRLGGYTDMATKFYVFTENGGAIEERLIDVFPFDGSAQVVVDTTLPPDTTPPMVLTVSPPDGDIGASILTNVTAAFSEAMDPQSIEPGNFELRDSSGDIVPCAANYNIVTNTATLVPSSPLGTEVTYGATVFGGTGGVTDASGNPLVADYGWTFTTAAAQGDTTPPTVPGNLSAVSGSTTQVNLTWTASTDNVGVTGYEVERCQGEGCTTFVQIATVTGTTYVDSGLTPGTTYQYRVRATDGAGNLSGYSNVATVTTQLSEPPLTITTQSLPDATLNVSYSTTLAVGGGTPLYTWSITSGSLPTGLSLNSGTGVISGTSTASGNFSFTVRAIDSSNPQQTATKDLSIIVVEQTTFTIWPATAVPATPAEPDTAAVELGVKFRSDSDGYITGIRFYKSTENTGIHLASLWTSGGQLLVQEIFTNESASGWQQVDFTTPVEITANTVYVASYHAPNGRYAEDVGYFATAGVDNGPLHALQDGESGGNGVYLYGAGGFPNNTWQSSNYWVDVVFQP